jgi:hypothetical protein
MFCAAEPIIGGTEGVGSSFHVLRSRTHFRWYRGHRVQFSCFALPDPFSAVPRALGPFFMFCARGPVFGGIDGVGSRFHVLHSRTHFQWYRGCRVPFSYFALSHPFSTVPRASSPVFIFCAPGHVFGGTDGVESRFQVLCSQTHFRRYRGRRVSFSYFALLDPFSAETMASGPVSCSALLDPFSAVPTASVFTRRVLFSCFVLLDPFSVVPMAS